MPKIKFLFAVLTTTIATPIWADDPWYYTEYKNEWSLSSWNYKNTQQFLRFGAEFDKWYVEAGPMLSGDGNTDISSEIGYKFKLTDRLQLKGKFETKADDAKLETEIRYYFGS